MARWGGSSCRLWRNGYALPTRASRRPSAGSSRSRASPGVFLPLLRGLCRRRLILQRDAADAAGLEACDQHGVRHLELVEAETQHVRQLVDQHLADGAQRPVEMMTAA